MWPINRIVLGFLLVVFLGFIPLAALAQDHPALSEDQVKAAFLKRFLQFTTWPEANHFDQETLVVGIIGNTPLGKEVLQLNGSTVGDYTLEVRSISSETGSIDLCQALVFCEKIDNLDRASHPLWKNLGWLDEKSVLLIGDDDDFIAAGGSISFFKQGDRLRFSISQKAVARGGLKISSKLMRLAKVVN
ncbi:MAG: YfiR family protein [bacterium]|nr:YfiR family protein [bacterium]